LTCFSGFYSNLACIVVVVAVVVWGPKKDLGMSKIVFQDALCFATSSSIYSTPSFCFLEKSLMLNTKMPIKLLTRSWRPVSGILYEIKLRFARPLEKLSVLIFLICLVKKLLRLFSSCLKINLRYQIANRLHYFPNKDQHYTSWKKLVGPTNIEKYFHNNCIWVCDGFI